MNIAIIYRSMTGHSKKIANKVAAELEVTAIDIKDKPKLADIDLLFIVGGIYSGTSLPDMLLYIETLDSTQIKKVALLTSSTSDNCGQNDVRKILESKTIEVVDEYRCFGNFLFVKLGHPNRKEIDRAIEFAKRLDEETK